MIHISSGEMWPPPESWTEVVVLWEDILEGPRFPIKRILDWLEATPGGRYHMSGYESTAGFCFKFQDPEDAVHFRLRWL